MTNQDIEKIINSARVVLFMKGTSEQPLCGFSAVVVKILANLGVEFTDVNVLENEELRHQIKEFSNWPTIPQLYIDNEFIGGADIVKELFLNKGLEDSLKDKGII